MSPKAPRSTAVFVLVATSLGASALLFYGRDGFQPLPAEEFERRRERKRAELKKVEAELRSHGVNVRRGRYDHVVDLCDWRGDTSILNAIRRLDLISDVNAGHYVVVEIGSNIDEAISHLQLPSCTAAWRRDVRRRLCEPVIRLGYPVI